MTIASSSTSRSTPTSKVPTVIQSNRWLIWRRRSRRPRPSRSNESITPKKERDPIAADATTPESRPSLLPTEQEDERRRKRNTDDQPG